MAIPGKIGFNDVYPTLGYVGAKHLDDLIKDQRFAEWEDMPHSLVVQMLKECASKIKLLMPKEESPSKRARNWTHD